MGILRQFGQLLWKNVITRKREPHILLLEIVWPILTFIIVALIRSAIPPTDQPTCSYAPHAMPSAGLVPFLQSAICNIENACEEREALEARLTKSAKLSALVSDVEPFLVRQTTLDALDSMETGIKLAEILADTSTNATFNNILGNDTMKVKSFFKDPDKVRKILVQDLGVMSSTIADAFLESTVNIFELLNSITTGYIDFRGIVCDPTKLKTYMFFPKYVNLTAVSKELCGIPDNAIPGIVNMVQQQLDIAAIFRVAKSLTSLTNDYTLANGLDDVAAMVELLSGTSGLSAMLSSADLKNMKELLNNIPAYLETINKMGGLDTQSIDDLMTFVEPLVHRYSTNLAMWNETKALFQQVKVISQQVGSGVNTNWTALLNNGLSSVFSLFANSSDLAWMTQLQSIPDLTNITMALFSGDMSALNQLTSDTSMDSLQQTISSFIGEPTMQTMLGITDTFVDMIKLSLDYLKESSQDIGEIMKDNSVVRQAADTVMSYGPDVTMDVIYRMLQIDNVLALYNNTNNYMSVCHQVIQDVKGINTTTRAKLDNSLCTQEITTALEQIVATFDTKLFQKQMETHFMNLQSLLSSSMVPTTMKLSEVYTRAINITDYLTSWFSSDTSVWFDNLLSQTSVDVTKEEWSDVSNRVSNMMRDMSWSMIIVTVGPVVEGTDMWQTVGPIVRSVDVFMENMMKQMGLGDDKSSSMAKMDEMLKYVMKYTPEITQSLFDMMKDQNMMTEVFSSTSMEDFCGKNILLNMSMPSYVPVEDINNLLCKTDWDQVVSDMVSSYDVVGQISKMMESLNTTDSSPFDWTGMVQNMDQMMTYYSDPMSVTVNNPIVTLLNMNMSVIDQTMDVIMYNLQQMNVQDMTSLTTTGLSGMQQLDAYLSLNNMYRTIRIYVDLWNAFAVLSNKRIEYPELYTNASYLETFSATFADFIETSSSTVPDLLTALKNTTIDVTKFFQVLLSGDWNKICDGTKITDLLTSSHDLQKFEDKLCNLNWTQILTEIQNTDVDVKRFAEKVNNLATIDWDNVPYIDLKWESVIYNTQKMIELLMKSDFNIFGGTSWWNAVFPGLDLQKSNTTWNDFVSIFNFANGLDMQNLINIFDGLNAVGSSLTHMGMNGTVSMMEADILQSQMYSYHLILKFTIKQLQYFNDTKHIDLRQYFKSSEMNKIFDVISSSPEVTTVALMSLIQTMQNPSKVNTLMTSWDVMCNDLSVFKSIILIPVNTTVNPTDLQTKICGLNLNVTKLFEEVSAGVEGFQDLMESIVNISGRATPSQVAEEYNVLNQLFMDLITNPPNITISHNNDWLMESKYNKAWEDFLHKLNEGLMTENTVNTLSSISAQSIESVIQSLAAIPEFQSILKYMSVYMTVVINRFNESLSAQDINSLYKGYPEMQKAALLLDDLPNLYQAWVFNSIYHSNKLSGLLSVTSWDQYCDKTEPLFDVPGANFSVSDFKSKLCQLNLTQLMIESTDYHGISEIENLLKMDNTTGAVDTAKLIQQYNQFSAQLLSNIERLTAQTTTDLTLPRFLNMQYWMDTTNYLNMVLGDPTRLMSLTSTLPNLIQSTGGGDLMNFTRMMMDADPFFKQMIQTYKATYYIMQHVISRIENKTVIRAEDIFGNATETIKLWGLFVRSGVLETMLNSVNTPQMSSLFAKTNITEVIMLLCHSGNFSHYFTVPSYITLDIQQLETDFCALDLMKIATEFMHELQVYDTIIKEAFSNSSVIEWNMIAGFLGLDPTLSNQITALIVNQPMIQLPTSWMNESYWLNLLIHYTENRQDSSTTATELSVFMESLRPMLNEEPFASMGFIMDIYLQLLLDNLHTVNSTTLSLDNLFRSIPSISDIYKTLHINDSILNELLLSPIKKPEEFVKLLTATDPYKYFCENENYWHTIFVIGSDTPTKICSGNSSDVLEKLLKELKYSDYTSALSNMSALPDWTRIIQNSMKLSELLTSMVMSSNDKFDMSNILTTLSSYNNTDFLWNYMSLFSQFGQIVNSSDTLAWENLQAVFQSMHLATELSNYMIDQLITSGRVLDFGQLFKNTSVVIGLFNSIRINSESIDGVFTGYLRTDKVIKFLNIFEDSKGLESFLCDPQQWHELFNFPSSLNLTEIITPLCNKSDILAILEEQVDIQHIMSLVMNIMQQNQTFNIQTFTSDIEKLTSNMMKLFNFTSVDFSGLDLHKLGEINMTEILMAVLKEAEKLNANQEMYAKLMQDLLARSVNTTDHTSQLPGYLLAAANVWISVFNKQLTEFLNKPMNFTSFLSGSVGKLSDLLVSDLSWMHELLDAEINPQKLFDMLIYNSSAICTEGFWDSVVTNGNLSAVHKILREICSINESSIIQEAMSGFLNSHLLSKQLEMLTEEYKRGHMEWNVTSLSPNIMELLNILMNIPTNHQTSDFSHLFNVTSFSSIMKRLETMLQQELGSQLTQWSSSVFSSILPTTDPMLVKAIQTFTVVIEEINSRLMYMQGTVSLSTLLKNSTELVDIFESILNIGRNGTDAVISNNIDVSKLTEVLASPDMFTGLCKNNTLADYITPKGVMSPVAADLSKVMCIFPEATLQVLMDQTRSDKLQKQIDKIWNSNTTGAVDWETVQLHINNFTALLTTLIEKPSTVDPNLMTTLDLTMIWKSMEGLFQNPQMLLALAGSASPMLNIPVDTSVYPYYLTWQEVYTQMHAVLKSLEGSPASTNGAIQNMWNAMVSMNSQLNLIQQNGSYTDLVAELGKDAALQSQVCDMDWVKKAAGSDQAQNVYNALCGQDPKDWNKRLTDLGFPEFYGYFLLTNMIKDNYSDMTMSALFNKFVTQVQNLTASLGSLSPSDIDRLQHILLGDLNNLTINPQFYQSFSWLNLIDNSTEGWLLGMLNFVTEVNSYVERQLSLLKGMGEDVPLTLLLPNNTVVAQLLEEAFGKQTAATIMAFNLAPDKFLEIAFSNSWKDAICQDVDKFADTFRIPVDSGTNITKLQHDLCEDLSKKDSTINSLLQRLDMKDVFKAFDDWMMGKTSSMPKTNYTNLYMAIQHKIEEFVATVTRIQNYTFTDSGMDAWLKPIWAAMENLNTPQNGIGDMCDATLSYIESTPLYRDSIRPVLLGVYQNMQGTLNQMQLQHVVEDLICGASKNSSDFLQKIVSSNLTALLAKVLNPSMDTSGSFQCSEMVKLSNDLSTMMNATIFNMMTGNNFQHCGDNLYNSFMMFIQDSSASFQLVQEILKMLSDPSLQSLLGNQDLLPVVDFFLNAYSQQQSVSLKFMDILIKPGNLTSVLQQLSNLAPETINSLLQSMLKADSTKLMNMSSAELESLLCNPAELDKFMTLPEFSNTSMSEISKMLCYDETKEIAGVIQGLLNINLLNTVQTANATDLTWWTVSLGHIADLIGQLNALGSLPALDFSALDFNNLQADLITYMQKFLFDNGPEAIARSLNALVEDFARLDPMVLSSSVVKDIKTVTLGLTSLKAIRNFIPPNVLIRDVIKDRVAFHDYLTKQLNISSSVADTIIDSTIQYAVLLPVKDKDIHGLVCDPTRLSTVLTLPQSSSVKTEHVVASLCSLSEAQAINLTTSLLMELDIGDLVKRYVSSGLDSFLQSFNQTQDEITDAVKKLTAAQSDFQNVTKVFQDSVNRLNLNIMLEPEYLTGSEGEKTIGDILCGYETSRISNSEASDDITGASSQLEGITNMVQRQEKELSDMPVTCVNVYDLVKNMENGPILWEYLKPLMWGKILYTPDTPASRIITEKVYNSSFKALADVQTIVASWSAGTKSLLDLMKNTKMKSNLESVLENPVVDNLMQVTFGVSGSDFLNGFYSIDSINTTQLDAIASIANVMNEYISCVVTDRFEAVSSEQQLLMRASELSKNAQFLAGLVFENIGNGNRKKRDTTVNLPKHVSYKIRMDIDNVMHTMRLKEQFWRPKPEDNFFTELRYLRGFAQLQDITERSIISLQTGVEVDSPSYLQQFPTPCYKQDTYLFALSAYLLPVLMTLAWLFSVAIATRHLMKDRENGQEEILKIMGMNSIINFWVWFICSMLMMGIVSVLCVVTLRVGNMFVYSNFGILILYFLVFCFSTTMLCYMVSAFFTRTTLALLTVVIVYFLTYLPYIVLTSMEADMLFWQKTLACLSSTTAFGFGAQYLSRHEILMEGVQWSNINVSPIDGDEMNFSWTCIMMLIDGGIYLVIGWYIRNVKPGKYGVGHPWYFPLSPYYWGCMSPTTSKGDKYKKQDSYLNEPMDKHMIAGISVRNLSKKYGKKEVVDHISADFYENQTTILLGHNGAAKTTTLNMITGVLQPSSGNIQIYGKSLSKARHIGVCPQHNALYDYMTVQEHMKFYGSVKCNWPKHQLEENIYQLLKEIGLLHVSDTKVSQLSGGMKRRLSVALAFVGGSECVILDEPSSGVDPSARRAMWNLISKRKINCTVLLSTHFLDEADIIGDRIAIMHNGRIMCAGSSHFLKAHLGSGYHLKIAKGAHCDQMSVMGTITSLLPRADVVEDIGSEMTVSLSATVANAGGLQKCLHQLDVHGEELGIASYGLYDTTLEEVFMKVCNVSDRNIPLTDEVMHGLRKQTKADMYSTTEKESEPVPDYDEEPIPYSDPRNRIGTCSYGIQQIWALLLKRFNHYRRDWRMLIGLVIIPLLFMTAALGFYKIKPKITAPEKILTPALYGPDTYIFLQDNMNSALTQKMKDHLMTNPGPGTTCMTGMNLDDPFKCVAAETSFHTVASPIGTPECNCVENKYTCNEAAQNLQVPWLITNTTDILQNLDGHDVTDYLLMTRNQYKDKRYGGWSFNADGSKFRSTVWFNNKGHHALPSFYNGLSNTMLRSLVPNNAHEYGITAKTHPIMLTEGQLDKDTLIQKAADYGIAVTFLVALTFIPVGLVVFLVNEHVNKEKQLQFLSGVGPFMYWVTSLLWDMFLYCIVIGLFVGLMAIFQQDAYWERDNLPVVVTLMILYGWATITQFYMTVKLYKDSTTSYFIMFCLNIFIGLTTMAAIFMLQFFSQTESVENAYNVMKYLLKIFPPFCLVSGFVEIIFNQIMSDVLNRFGDDAYVWPFSFDVVGWHLVALAIEGFVFFIITLLVEIRCASGERMRTRRHEEELDYFDEAVTNERTRVTSGYAGDDVLVINNLTKEYKRGRREFYAVDHMCLGVPKSECFGLLGANGAGKTTTFRMLTGDLLPTAGTAKIKGQRITRGDSNIGQEIGYCPQENALDSRLTGRELLHCYARLRGLPDDSRKYVVNDLIKRFRLHEADKMVHAYSGGMKRKLSVAMAMIGEPPVVLLDEPTTGMDPNTRRHVWNILLSAVKNQQSVVISSHSMEECDALCTRLAIMVNGEFKCLGSPQQLKHSYGDGYIVTVYMAGLSTNRVRVRDFFLSTFSGARIGNIWPEENHGVVQVEIPKGKSSVADIFVHLERVKEEFNIVHYSVSQTTLDNVFLNFARDQNDGVTPEIYESSSEGSHSGGTWGQSSSEAFTNPHYSFVNDGFSHDKDSIPVKFTSDVKQGPLYATKM